MPAAQFSIAQDNCKYFLAHFGIQISHQLVSALICHDCIHRLDFEVEVGQLADVPHPVPLELKEKSKLRMAFNIIVTSKIIIDHCRLLWTTMDHHY